MVGTGSWRRTVRDGWHVGSGLHRWFAVLVGCVLAPTLSIAQSSTTADRRAQIDAIFSAWDSTSSPGCAVAVTRGGKPEYTRGYGMANLEYDAAITPESIFHVASVSKQVTAVSVALLARDGRLSLDDDIRRYLPELPDYGTPIRIRHLIHHTSGLRDQWDLLRLADWRTDDLITEDDVLQIVARQRQTNFEPGAEYVYSNTGYTLLAIVVKRVSGQSLQEFADAHIFKPLSMHDTHFHDDHTMIVRRRTSAYLPRQGGGWRVSIPVFDTYGATSLFTTVGDLLQWEQNFVHAQVGGRALIDQIQRPANLNDGHETGYAFGLTVGFHRGLRTIGHSGADAGYRADVVRFPDHDLAVVALCNASPIVPAVLTRRVAEVYLGEAMTPVTPPTVLAESELRRFAGVYWNPVTDEVRRLSITDGRLTALNTPQPLVPLGGSRFRQGDLATEWTFLPQSGTSPEALQIVSLPLKPAVFQRTQPPALSPDALRLHVGEYYSQELDITYLVTKRDDGRVVIRSRKRPAVLLEPVSGDRFTAEGFGTVTFTRGSSGTIDGMTISTGRVRRVQFVRTPAPRR